jgi:hypothetical protein
VSRWNLGALPSESLLSQSPHRDLANHAGRGHVQLNPGSYTSRAPSWEERATDISQPKPAGLLVTNPPVIDRSALSPSLCAEPSLRSPLLDRSVTPAGAVPEATLACSCMTRLRRQWWLRTMSAIACYSSLRSQLRHDLAQADELSLPTLASSLGPHEVIEPVLRAAAGTSPNRRGLVDVVWFPNRRQLSGRRLLSASLPPVSGRPLWIQRVS